METLTRKEAAVVEEKKPLKIMLMDDSPTIRSFLRQVLEKHFEGCDIEECEDGKEGIRALSKSKVDVIITDLQMPGMDGHRFLELIKRNPILSKKPVLVMSSEITPELVGTYQQQANIAFLPKPASKTTIIEFIEQLLKA